MSCILVIFSEDFDVDTFISKNYFEPYKIFRKGEPKFKTKPDGEKKDYSGLNIEVSKAGFNDFDTQVKDAIMYLKENTEKLKSISLDKKIQRAVLDFGLDLRSCLKFQDNEYVKELLPQRG